MKLIFLGIINIVCFKSDTTYIHIQSIFIIYMDLDVYGIFPITITINLASHCLFIKESGGPQLAVQSDEICPNVLARSFRFHCPMVGPNFSMTMKSYNQSSNRV